MSIQVQHGAFTIERRFAASPAQVFAAWAGREAKLRWFGSSEWQRDAYTLDFRIGGHEYSSVTPPGGVPHIYDARYEDIVPDRRIIISYHMLIGDIRISASLLTIELQPAGDGTQMRLTEQIAVLDERYPVENREQGTRWLLDMLDASLHQPN